MKRLIWNKLSRYEQESVLRRPAITQKTGLLETVRAIVESVRTRGDLALQELSQTLDHVALKSFSLDPHDIESASVQLSHELRAAIERAYSHISAFHRLQIPQNIKLETSPGIVCERRFSPIERVGLYVPGGSAALPSTMLMLGIPALIAGSSLKVVCTPPGPNGFVHPAILAAARLCKVDHVFTIGGAQAIAAMAYGTQSVPKVDKIFGPGNAYVTQAKQCVAQDPFGATCDMPAGPSEVFIIADGSTPAQFTAADMLSQAEHSEDAQVIVVSPHAAVLDTIALEIESQLPRLKRARIASCALDHSYLIEVSSLCDALVLSEAYAPEHLLVQVQNAREFSANIKHAGSVFLGTFAPESIGDYASGTNHVLPTYGFAKTMGGLSVESFFTSSTFQEVSREGLLDIASTVELLAQCEDLDAHARAVSLRREFIARGQA